MVVSALSVIDLQASSSARSIAVIGTSPRESSKPLNSNSGLTLLELLWATSANLHLRWRVCHAQSFSISQTSIGANRSTPPASGLVCHRGRHTFRSDVGGDRSDSIQVACRLLLIILPCLRCLSWRNLHGVTPTASKRALPLLLF